MNKYTQQAVKRIRGKMTQKDFSELLGYDNPQFISFMENGHSKIPVECIYKLKRLGINVRPLIKAVVKDFETNLKEQVK